MKKIILGIVFVFTIVTLVNATSNVQSKFDKIQTSCQEVAGNFASLAYDSGVSVEDCMGIYDIIMDNCRES